MSDPMTDPPSITCDCGSEDVRAEVGDVQGRGKTIMFICNACRRAWRNTEPTIGEQILTAASPIGKTWTR